MTTGATGWRNWRIRLGQLSIGQRMSIGFAVLLLLLSVQLALSLVGLGRVKRLQDRQVQQIMPRERSSCRLKDAVLHQTIATSDCLSGLKRDGRQTLSRAQKRTRRALQQMLAANPDLPAQRRINTKIAPLLRTYNALTAGLVAERGACGPHGAAATQREASGPAAVTPRRMLIQLEQVQRRLLAESQTFHEALHEQRHALLDRTERSIGAMRVVLTLMGVLMLVAFLVTAAITIQMVRRPVRQLVSAAQRLSTGTGSAPAPQPAPRLTGNEMQVLSKAFEEMAGALRNRQQERQQFLAILAHELRNPIAAISNATQLLAREIDGRSDPPLERYAAIIDRQVTSLTVMLGDLLAVSRLDGGHLQLDPRPTEITQQVRRSVEAFSPRLERGMRIDLQLPNDPVWCKVDPVRFDQILTNLLGNAAKFGRAGGHIALELQRQEGSVRLTVRDNGVGIPRDFLPHIFQPFARRDPTPRHSAGGLGLGLSLVRKLVLQFGGQVEAHSAGPGRGCEITITLPALPAPSPAVAHSPLPEGESTSDAARRSVLVVDDNPDVSQTLAEMVAGLGHAVRVAHDGPSAVEAALAAPPDLMLVDLLMPGMDGYQVAEQLVQRLPPQARTRLVALSGQPDSERSARAGFAEHILKPISLARLRQLLDALPCREHSRARHG